MSLLQWQRTMTIKNNDTVTGIKSYLPRALETRIQRPLSDCATIVQRPEPCRNRYGLIRLGTAWGGLKEHDYGVLAEWNVHGVWDKRACDTGMQREMTAGKNGRCTAKRWLRTATSPRNFHGQLRLQCTAGIQFYGNSAIIIRFYNTQQHSHSSILQHSTATTRS